MGAQVNLALTCKAMLPVLCMGRVVVRLSPTGLSLDGLSLRKNIARPLLHASRCLAKDPGAVTHLELTSWQEQKFYGTRQLIELGCAQVTQPLTWR